MQCEQLKAISLPTSVTSIGKQALAYTHLEAINIPSSITKLSESVFAHNIYLASVNIPNSVMSIGENAFYNCQALSSIVLPSSIKDIGAQAFHNCDGLTKITSFIEEPFSAIPVSESLGFPLEVFGKKAYNATPYVPVGTKAKYEATDGWKEFKNIVEMTPYDVLDDNTAAAHFLQPDEEGKVEIPATVDIDGKTYTVTEIAADAFKDNKELTEVTIPGTVTTIGDGAFAGCENLRGIYVFAPEPISLTAAEARTMVTRAAEGVPSQLEGINFDACTLYVPVGSEQKVNEAVYNLSGQRLATPKKGLNIIGGRKVVVR